jgi:hypothetical protein
MKLADIVSNVSLNRNIKDVDTVLLLQSPVLVVLRRLTLPLTIVNQMIFRLNGIVEVVLEDSTEINIKTVLV